MGKNIEFTDEELEMLYTIVVKEKNGLKHVNHGTIMGKESLDNYSKDLADLQLKIKKVKKEKIEILIVTNTADQARLKSRDFIEKMRQKIKDFELGKSKTIYIKSESHTSLFHGIKPIGLKIYLNKLYNYVDIEVENDDTIKEIKLRFMGSTAMFDGMCYDAATVDYPTFYGKNVFYNESIAEKVYELEQKLKPVLIQSKYYQKELPQLVKMLLD